MSSGSDVAVLVGAVPNTWAAPRYRQAVSSRPSASGATLASEKRLVSACFGLQNLPAASVGLECQTLNAYANRYSPFSMQKRAGYNAFGLLRRSTTPPNFTWTSSASPVAAACRTFPATPS